MNILFTYTNLTDEEVLAARTWTPLQRSYLQNLLCQTAHEQVNLDFDGNNPTQFAQNQAFLKGQISLLLHLLETPVVAPAVPSDAS